MKLTSGLYAGMVAVGIAVLLTASASVPATSAAWSPARMARKAACG